jgi:hypothetical protein
MKMIIVSAKCAIAVARRARQALPVDDRDPAMPVPNVAGILQHQCASSDGGSRDTEDARERLLREFNDVGLQFVLGREQPSTEALRCAVEPVADDSLPDLTLQVVSVAQQ